MIIIGIIAGIILWSLAITFFMLIIYSGKQCEEKMKQEFKTMMEESHASKIDC
jgi:hypothetical protein